MTKNNIKVSIIVPVYNADIYLEECLNSLINQSLKEIEIICINDNSKDNSLKILKKFAKKDNRIKLINLENTYGQSHTRNIGVENAIGEYIGFTDADDFVELTMYEKMYNSSVSKKAEIAMCRAKVFDDSVKNFKDDDYFALKCLDENEIGKTFNHHQTLKFMSEINVSVWNKLYKTEFLKRIGVKFKEGFIYEDLPYFYETYTKTSKVILVDEFLYNYRQNSQNSTMTRHDANVKDRVDMMSFTYEILKKQIYFEEEKADILSWIIHDLFYRCLLIDSKYQKEYLFRMQKFFKNIDTTDIDASMLKTPYYPHFCEIKKGNYQEIIKYFFDKETLGEAYVEKARLQFEQDFKALSEKYKKVEQLEEDNLRKKYDLENLEEKILENEKQYWKNIEAKEADLKSLQQKNFAEIEKRQTELNNSQELLDKEWKAFEKERNQKQAELDKAWDDFKIETKKREQSLEELQNRILADEKDRWKEYEIKKAEFEKEKEVEYKHIKNYNNDLISSKEMLDSDWKKFEQERDRRQAELDKAWEDFKIETKKREQSLEELQNRILAEEKDRWKEYEIKKAEFEKECQEKLEIERANIKRRKNLNKLAVEKAKNILSNKYLEDVAKEKKNIAKDMEKEFEKNQEYYSSLLNEQLKIQENNYKKASEYKKKTGLNNFSDKDGDRIMNKPKVSIILPVYNVAPYLRQSLDSIIEQTLSDIEIICVNDGSTDESGKILDEYKEKDSRIKVVHKKNAGTGAARNDGLKLATGECIGFVDPDDWILPNMYERLYNILQEKELDIVMFVPDVYNDRTKKHEGFLYFQNSNFPEFLDNKIFNKDDISPFSYPMCVWNKLYRKKLFDENNIDFAEGLDFEDHKVIFKSLFTAKRIYFIREKLYVYRHSREGSILSDNDTRMFDHIKIYDIVENILKETGNWEKFHLDFLRYKVHNILYYYTMIKPQYKKEYYIKMVKSLRATKMSEEEINILNKDYPDLKPIMEDTLVNKIKKSVKKIIKKTK